MSDAESSGATTDYDDLDLDLDLDLDTTASDLTFAMMSDDTVIGDAPQHSVGSVAASRLNYDAGGDINYADRLQDGTDVAKIRNDPVIQARLLEVLTLSAYKRLNDEGARKFSLIRAIRSSYVAQGLWMVFLSLVFLVFSPLILAGLLVYLPCRIFNRSGYSDPLKSYIFVLLFTAVPVGAFTNVVLAITTDVSVSKTETFMPLVLYLTITVTLGIIRGVNERVRGRRRREFERGDEESTSSSSSGTFLSDSSACSADQLMYMLDKNHRDVLYQELTNKLVFFMNDQTEVLTSSTFIFATATFSFVVAVAHAFVGPIFRAVNDDGRDFYGSVGSTVIQDRIVLLVSIYCMVIIGTGFVFAVILSAAEFWERTRKYSFYHGLADGSVPLFRDAIDYRLAFIKPPDKKDLGGRFQLKFDKPFNLKVWILLREQVRDMGSDEMATIRESTVLIALFYLLIFALIMFYRVVVISVALDELAVFTLVDSIFFLAYLLSVGQAGIILTSYNARDNDLLRNSVLQVQGHRDKLEVKLREKRDALTKSRDKRDAKKDNDSAFKKYTKQIKKKNKEIAALTLEADQDDLLISTMRTLMESNAHEDPVKVSGIPLTTDLRNKLLGLGVSSITAGAVRVFNIA
ncbi:uncharacterized protein AMSG_04494 [Thecamonas trahens ATCC 50062]|uniref:Uncharacterized protein n=1 Tax=Thecamonas trahens ATCC 50062 TaxID=461836 RepID=A0A0L0D7D3_THETB|nr:hypothetical protein AMSG_04494 [Thecamonas trahens ATCC 50062]KNC48264.1 hypothetical protein AMSG_04494 [Thecamonas trahens ATCC 50062]|eukprot:XP_013758831.1 hypothetical protein AMSG_04494 [Thecamonas trahens ATCC 50062]